VPSLALPFSSARASKWPAAQPVLSVICRIHPRWWWVGNRGYFCVCIILYTPALLSDTHHSWHSQQQQRKSSSLPASGVCFIFVCFIGSHNIYRLFVYRGLHWDTHHSNIHHPSFNMPLNDIPLLYLEFISNCRHPYFIWQVGPMLDSCQEISEHTWVVFHPDISPHWLNMYIEWTIEIRIRVPEAFWYSDAGHCAKVLVAPDRLLLGVDEKGLGC